MRDLCKKCRKRPVAINYYKNGKTFFRSVCDHCSKKYKTSRPNWVNSGYQKKTICDRCGFKGIDEEQFDVYHADGDLTNCRYSNLKTVCANCQRVLHKFKLPWKQGDLIADL